MPSSPSAAGASPSDSDELLQEYLELWADKGMDAVRGAAAENGPLSKRLEVLQDLEDLAAALDPGDRSILDPPEELKLDHLDRFEALELIGIGGLARVYRAYDPELSRQVALKVFDSSRWVTESSLNWILNEGRTIARLDHPGVVRVYEVGQHDGLAFMAMELIEGPSLQDLLDFFRGTTEGEASEELQVAAGRLTSIRARCKLLRTVADTLAYGHSQGIVHRDVKPANVLLAKDGTPKLIDFGLAHLPESGSLTDVTERLVGTPAYVAPEQVDSGQTGADPKSDQFSLGVLMYELLTLENPFERGTRAETMAAVSRAAPPRPRSLNRQIPAALETVCLHALEAQPSRRYADVGALVEDLDAFLENRATSLGSSGAMAARLWLRRNRARLLRTAGIGLALAGTLVARDTWKSYEAIQAERALLAELQPTLTGLRDEEQLSAAFETLERTNERTAEERYAIGMGPLARGLRQAKNEFLRHLSLALFNAIEEGYYLADPFSIPPSVKEEQDSYNYRRWQDLLKREENLYRDGSDLVTDARCLLLTDIHRARGTFTLPTALPGQRIELRSMDMSPTSAYSNARVLTWPLANITEGVFRISAVDESTGRVQGEIDVFVVLGMPQQVFSEMPSSEHLHFEIQVESLELTFRNMGREPVTEHLDSFELTGLVTWKDLLAVQPKETVDYLRKSRPWSDPAILNAKHAQAFALAVGARMPSVLELRAAHLEGKISLEGTGLSAEYAFEPFVGDLTKSAAYHAHAPGTRGPDAKDPASPTLRWLSDFNAWDYQPTVGFRLARTVRYDD